MAISVSRRSATGWAMAVLSRGVEARPESPSSSCRGRQRIHKDRPDCHNWVRLFLMSGIRAEALALDFI